MFHVIMVFSYLQVEMHVNGKNCELKTSFAAKAHKSVDESLATVSHC